MTHKIKDLAGQALDQAVPYTWTTLNYQQIQLLLACHADLVAQACIEAIQGLTIPDTDQQTSQGYEHWNHALLHAKLEIEDLFPAVKNNGQ